MEIDWTLDNSDIIHKYVVLKGLKKVLFKKVQYFKWYNMFLRECLKYCFHGLIQKELDDMREVHNTHRIRPYPNQECPSGRPDIIYAVPETYGNDNQFLSKSCIEKLFIKQILNFFVGTSDYKININQAYLTLAKPYTTEKNPLGCNTEFEKVALQLMINKSLTFPNNGEEAKKLVVKLIEAIDNI